MSLALVPSINSGSLSEPGLSSPGIGGSEAVIPRLHLGWTGPPPTSAPGSTPKPAAASGPGTWGTAASAGSGARSFERIFLGFTTGSSKIFSRNWFTWVVTFFCTCS
eukprot:CAMPEP_0204433512 /NCGR_PEP_ID=MMETSP0470-20130426/69710_1 /ASSEMBLY_ACC=CAM_ASM_000385 /TAXON_ID=2969 /ORGANISM="Oxyrrhis marina" /LENGTH=106 /DNA_ID=CAMNT_0051431927 /DNA_START=145 /DNA_END=465 /DNA_ORIENTATION=-